MIQAWDLAVQLFHILLFGPFLIYVGFAIPPQDFVYQMVLALGFLVILSFIAAIIKEPTREIGGWLLWHIVVISGLLLWCGIQKTQTPPIVFSLLIALGFAAIGYHALRLVQSLGNLRSSA
jgi:hypothetical protein